MKPTEIYALSLHDALPIAEHPARLTASPGCIQERQLRRECGRERSQKRVQRRVGRRKLDRKSTTSELQSRGHLVCRLLLEKKKRRNTKRRRSTGELHVAI